MRGTRIFRALFPFSLPIIAIPVIAMMFIQFQDCYISSSGYLECFTNLVSLLSWNSRVKQWQDVNDEEFKKRYEEMESSFRVFVYPEGDPKTYYQTPGELSGPYASEGYFFKNIMESPLRTENPDEATMFFIPISVQKMSAKGLPIRKMRNVVKKYIEEISSKYPYWDRNFGMDHFFVSCHEMGLNVTQGVQHLVRHAIRVVCFPNKKDGYVRAKDLTLPQLLLPFVNHAAGTDTKMRTRLSLLAGQDSTEADLDFLISRRISMPRKRTEANVLWTPNYYTTKFCLCPGGSQMDNARIADAIHYGCVPVIWPDHNDLPLSGIIRWELFSLKLKEDIVYFVEVEEFLQSISDAEYKARQNNTVKVQLHFQWNSPPLRYDAFHFIMLQLFERYMDRRHAFELAKATKIDW